MNFNEETYWQVEDYLNGKLKGNALLEFENKIIQDINLKYEIDLQRLANKLIVDNRILSASQISLNTKASYKKDTLNTKIVFSGIAVLLSLGISYFIYPSKDSPSSISTESNAKKALSINSDTIIQAPQYQPVANSEIAGNKTKEPTQRSSPAILPATFDSPIDSEVTQPELIKTKNVIPENPLDQQKSAPVVVDDKCSNVKISGHITVKNSCNNDSNGHIYVKGFLGGTSPYTYKVTSVKDGHYTSPDNNLSAGIYNVIILDHLDCFTTYSNIAVKEITCLEVEKSFNPFIGEILELGEKDQDGLIIVYSKNGDIHYSKDFHKNENLQWNGVANNGATETGYYIYTIKYKDGASVQGEVTVTR